MAKSLKFIFFGAYNVIFFWQIFFQEYLYERIRSRETHLDRSIFAASIYTAAAPIFREMVNQRHMFTSFLHYIDVGIARQHWPTT